MTYDEYYELPVKKHVKSPFTTEDDIRLAKIVTENPNMKWEDVAAMMGDRNVRQCKERWENYLSPNVNKTPFSHAEDVLLLKKLNEIGKKWRIIAKSFDNRTDISLKSRFKVLSRKGINLENVNSFREPYQLDEIFEGEDEECYYIGKLNKKKKLTSKERKQLKALKQKELKKDNKTNLPKKEKRTYKKASLQINTTENPNMKQFEILPLSSVDTMPSPSSPETDYIDLEIPDITNIFNDTTDSLNSQLFNPLINEDTELFPFF